MPINTEEALSAYGFVYTLAKNIPDLNTTLTQALKEGWTADKLTATIESSNWWNTHSDTVRNLAQQQYTDPATYTQNVNNAKGLITIKAQQLGRSIDDKTATSLALQTLTTNASWDDQVVSQLVTNNTKIAKTDIGASMGQAATLRDHLTQVFQSYGVPYTKQWLDFGVTQIESGRDSLDGFESYAKQKAKAAYPQFSQLIDAGQTVKDIADPYISTMAQTLEIPETEINLNDSHVQKALSQRSKDGSPVSQPLWEFQQQLKDDPRYDKTTQAKTDAMSALAKIGKDFGFAVGS